MISDESIRETIKECLEGKHAEVFKSMFSQIRQMTQEQTDKLIKEGEKE